MKECTTHRLACDCREKLFEASMEALRRAQWLKMASGQEIRLMFGEMTAQEIRAVKAAVNYICSKCDEQNP